ncbi:MAG: hypothetical protein Q7T62_02745 [Undibacterium sp.]|nr:hypothetical protein [Undibacterium sp.]
MDSSLKNDCLSILQPLPYATVQMAWVLAIEIISKNCLPMVGWFCYDSPPVEEDGKRSKEESMQRKRKHLQEVESAVKGFGRKERGG